MIVIVIVMVSSEQRAAASNEQQLVAAIFRKHDNSTIKHDGTGRNYIAVKKAFLFASYYFSTKQPGSLRSNTLLHRHPHPW